MQAVTTGRQEPYRRHRIGTIESMSPRGECNICEVLHANYSAFLFNLNAGLLAVPALAVGTLPPLGADLQQTSVSGLSSGGYMAGQFHAAHSKYVMGAAIIGAGPYACARSGVANSTSVFAVALAANLVQAETGCMKATLSRIADVLDGKRLASFAADLATREEIDPLQGLSRSKVYVFSGKDDTIVDSKVMATVRDFYAAASVPSEQISFNSDKEGGHAFLSETWGNACASNKPPFVDHCDYDQAGAIWFRLRRAVAQGKADATSFISFDQSNFAGADADPRPRALPTSPKLAGKTTVAKCMSSFMAAFSLKTRSVMQ